nr:calcium-responsive transcription factor-like [Hydra vulgaris]
MALFKTALSLEEAHNFIKDHELEYIVRFSTSFSTKGFGNTDLKEKNHKVFWSTDSIEFSGLPFMMIGTKILDCQNGRDRNLNLKEFNKQKRKAINFDHDYKRKYTRIQDCKKFDCPAQISITEYLEFPEYKLTVDTVRNRKEKSEELRYALTSLANKEINKIRKFCIVIPDILSHNGHMVAKDSGISQRIDPELVTAIDLFVKEGVLSTKEMKRLLNIQVKNNFNKPGHVLPETLNKRFFPRNSTIQNHIAFSRRKLCQSLIDQESLQLKIKKWKEADPAIHIFFRPKGL